DGDRGRERRGGAPARRGEGARDERDREREAGQERREGETTCHGCISFSLPRGRRGVWRAAGLLTRGSLPRRLPGLAASGVVAGERLPSQRRDRPGFAPEFPHRAPLWRRAYQRAHAVRVTQAVPRFVESCGLAAQGYQPVPLIPAGHPRFVSLIESSAPAWRSSPAPFSSWFPARW